MGWGDRDLQIYNSSKLRFCQSDEMCAMML